MRGAERVVSAFRAARKARWAILHSQLVHLRAPAGKNLVRVCLMADIPDDSVVRRVEDVMERDRELDRAEIRRQVTARPRDGRDQEGPELARELRKLGTVEPAQRSRIANLIEDGIHDVKIGR